eukprot:scaffold102687_cov36-Cyclotella_meneghiniana.AAC.1
MKYANFPAALVTNVITQYKVSERIKEINKKKASPKSAMDFDVEMMDSNEEVELNAPPSDAAASAANAAANHPSPPITQPSANPASSATTGT